LILQIKLLIRLRLLYKSWKRARIADRNNHRRHHFRTKNKIHFFIKRNCYNYTERMVLLRDLKF